MKLKLRFHDANEVRNFVDITSQYKDALSLVHGRYIVDAKSILGVLSMDLSQPIDLVCDHSNDSLENDLSKFVVR